MKHEISNANMYTREARKKRKRLMRLYYINAFLIRPAGILLIMGALYSIAYVINQLENTWPI